MTGTRKRDAKGRFLPASLPPAPKQRTLTLRDAKGRFLPVKKASAAKTPHVANLPGPKKPHGAKGPKPTRTRVIRRDKNGRFRDENGRFIHVDMGPAVEPGHGDGRKNDGPRVRRRPTFQEAVDLYGFEDYDEMPEWISYLEGAP